MKTARTIKDLGNLIRFHRLEKDLTQSELAKLSGLTQVSISRLEKGESVSFLALEKVLLALKLEISLTKIPEIDTSDLSTLLD